MVPERALFMNGTVGMYDERQRKGASALHAGFPGYVTRDVSSEEEGFSRVEHSPRLPIFESSLTR
jgi:hypothetical protein